MDSTLTEYNISEKEVLRRKGAFTALIISLWLGCIIFSIDFIINNIPLSIMIFGFAALILFLFRIMTFRYLNNLLNLKIIIIDDNLLRIWNKNEERIPFNVIRQINIKRTTGGYIRAIKIETDNKKMIIINGLEDFEQFEQDLLRRAVIVKIKEVKEPMDFDHPLFYPVFGLLVGFLITTGFKILTGLNHQNIQILVIGILIFNFLVSIYFYIAQPLSKALEKKRSNPDHVFSIFLILINIVIYLINFR